MATILIVDDHHSTCTLLGKLVGLHGHRGVCVESGGEALAYLEDHAVDLVILDVAMPGMSGLDVLRELGAEGRLPGLSVVMFSADERHRDESLRLGAVEYVLKHEADGLPALIRHYAAAVEART